MLDLFSGTHLLILLAVALSVIGPKDLPRIMRVAGQWMGKARRMADEFKRSFDEMARQEELDKLRAELDRLRQIPAQADAVPHGGEYQATEATPEGGKLP